MTDTLRTMLAALVAAGALAGDGVAQVAARVDAVRDGDVRMTFAARPGVCGWGEGNVRVISRRSSNEDWEAACEPGPVRVVLARRDGRTVEVDSYIGGRWRDRSGITDLGTVPAAAAAEFFLDLAETEDGDVAKDAVFPAAVADSVTVWPRLLRLARQTPRPTGVRKAAVFWVGQTDDEQAADGLWDLIRDGGPTELREHAVFALSQHASDRVPDRLRQLAADRDMDLDVRERAIFWLGQRDAAGSLEELVQLYERLDNQRLRERVIFAVSQGRDDDRAQWLIRVAESSQEPLELREKAIFWLGQSRGSTDRLYDLYDRLESQQLREKLIFAFSQRRDERALRMLMEIARDDQNRELRKKAIFWLGQSRDPRAAEFLEELIIR